MAFIPFGFYKAPAGASSWTPADLPNLYDYWEADSGVTGTTNVSAWAGKENGVSLTYGGNSQGPAVISAASGFNNQDILRFDRANSETLYKGLDAGSTIGTSTQVNFSMYADPEALASGTFRFFMGLSRRLNPPTIPEFIMGSNSSAFKAYKYAGSGNFASNTTTLAESSTPKQLMTMVLDYINDQGRVYFGTSQDANTPISIDPSAVSDGQRFTLFSYNPQRNAPELPGSGDLGGVAIWTGDTDFSTNLTNLETYFQNKYGA